MCDPLEILRGRKKVQMAKNFYQKNHKAAVNWVAKNITKEKFFKSSAKRLVNWGEGGAMATATGLAVKGTVDLAGKGLKVAGKFAKKAFDDAKNNMSKVIPFKKPEKQAANS